jgi:hypothetical protein
VPERRPSSASPGGSSGYTIGCASRFETAIASSEQETDGPDKRERQVVEIVHTDIPDAALAKRSRALKRLTLPGAAAPSENTLVGAARWR